VTGLPITQSRVTIRTMGLLLYALGLFLFWLVISGGSDLSSVVIGAAVTAAATLLFRSPLRGQWISENSENTDQERGRNWLARGLRLMVFVPVFVAKVLASGFAIFRLAVTPGVTFWPGIVRTPGGLHGTGSTTILANLITLTPGTITLDYDAVDDTLYIHWIDVSEYEAEDIDSEVTSNMRPWIREVTR
jgi:multicomponent Na+:H+ antiporter subunit E